MKRQLRRQQLRDKAREVFAERGYHATKIDHIVAHAEVARGTFYLHFEDKRAIFEELVDRFLARINGALVPIRVDNPEAPPLVQLHDNVRRVLAVGLDDPLMTKILLQDAMGLDGDFDKKVRAFFRELEELLVRSLKEGQRLGLVRPGGRAVMGAMALGAVKELLLQAGDGRLPRSADTLSAETMRFLASGVLASGVLMDAALGAQRHADSVLSDRPSALQPRPDGRY